jgi:hypothetical protein
MSIETSTQIRIQSARGWYFTVEDVNIEIGEDGCTISYWDEMAINDAGDKRSKYISFDKEEALAIADAIYKLFKE